MKQQYVLLIAKRAESEALSAHPRTRSVLHNKLLHKLSQKHKEQEPWLLVSFLCVSL